MATDIYKNSCGKIEQLFTLDQLTNFVKIFKMVPTNDGAGNTCHGIAQGHPAYPWLKKTVLPPIIERFNPDLKLIFAMLLDCVKPFDIHYDLKPLPAVGNHFLSFLIPYAVNNDPELCKYASTILFEQSYNGIEPEKMPELKSNALDIHESHISHVPIEQACRVSLLTELIWHPGDLLWWDSHLLHTSNNFIKNGYTSKQGIIIHTYV